MNPEDVSVADFMKWNGSTAGGRILRWFFAKSHGERTIILEETLGHAYAALVDVRGIIVGKERGEDEISMQLVQILNAAGIAAVHDQHVNGHCDVVVNHESGYRWLGEAKVHSGYKWLTDGFLQLSTRYGTAIPGKDRGELIIYHMGGKSLSVLTEWRELLEKDFTAAKVTEDKISDGLFFRTEHDCVNSGCKFYVRHTIVPLMHDPKK